MKKRQGISSRGNRIKHDLGDRTKNISITTSSGTSKAATEKKQPWADLEWKSKYRFWDNTEMMIYNQMKLKYWIENRDTKAPVAFVGAQELISRYLRPLRYRETKADEESSTDTRKGSDVDHLATYTQHEWWTKLPVLSNEELCSHCWKCSSQSAPLEEAESNYNSLISGRVRKELKIMVRRWRNDQHMLAHLSLFGKEFHRAAISSNDQ